MTKVALDQPQVGIAVADVHRRVFAMVNPEFARMHGYSVDEMRGMPVEHVFSPDERARLPDLSRRVEERGELRFESVHIDRTGRCFPVRVDVAIVRDDSGAPVYRLATVIDLEREARRQAIARGRTRTLELLATGAPLAEVLTALVEAIEAALPGVIGSVLLVERGRLRSGAAPGLPDFYNDAVDGLEVADGAGCCGTAAYRGERVVVEDVETHPYWAPYREIARRAGLRSCWSEPVFSSDRRVIGTFAMYYREPRAPDDESLGLIEAAAHLASLAIEQRKTEALLRDEKERYRTLVEHASEALVVLDADSFHLVDANPKAVVLFGFEQGELIGMPLPALCPELQPDGRRSEEAAREYVEAALRGEVPVFEWVHRDRSGCDIPCEVRLVRLPSANRRLVRGAMTDIRERKREQEMRRALEERVQQTQRLDSLGLLAGGVAHDFNNLLVGILGNASLALADLPENSPARPAVRKIEEAARRAADLAAEMLAYSGRAKQGRAPLHLSSLVLDTLPLLDKVVAEGVTIERDLAPDLEWMEGDPTQVRQVLMNLITNASQSFLGRPGVIRVRTDHAVLDEEALRFSVPGSPAPGRYVVLEVSDDGCGMDEDTKRRIFDPFYSGRPNGRGLGLASVQGIVRGHGGVILVDSEPGRGSRFRVLFPATAAEPGSDLLDAFRRSPVPERPGYRGSGRVLLADDEPWVREFCAEVLSRAGFDVVQADSGRAAVTQFRTQREPVRLVIMDLLMPGMDGDTALNRIRQLDPDVPAILQSGFRREEPASARRSALTEFLAKPYTAGELLAVVERVLERKAPGANAESV